MDAFIVKIRSPQVKHQVILSVPLNDCTWLYRSFKKKYSNCEPSPKEYLRAGNKQEHHLIPNVKICLVWCAIHVLYDLLLAEEVSLEK